MIPLAAHTITFTLPQVPAEVWSALISVAATLFVQYLHGRGIKLPLLDYLLDWLVHKRLPMPTPSAGPLRLPGPPADASPVDLENHPTIRRIIERIDGRDRDRPPLRPHVEGG